MATLSNMPWLDLSTQVVAEMNNTNMNIYPILSYYTANFHKITYKLTKLMFSERNCAPQTNLLLILNSLLGITRLLN